MDGLACNLVVHQRAYKILQAVSQFVDRGLIATPLDL